jgi:hypothetical protein
VPLDDPNDPQEPQAPPEAQPAPEPEPQAPQYRIETAYNVIAQHEGWDPRLTRYEVQEQKRRKEELDRRERELEARTQRRFEPPEDTSDPYMRRISNIERVLMEDLEDKRRTREKQETERRIENELSSGYTDLARRSGMTPEQMEQRSRDFYGALADLYPEYDIIQRVGVERAIRAAFERVSRSNGNRTMPGVVGRGPTATRTIPGSPQPYAGVGNPMPPEENLSAEQLDGETDDQYRARLERIISGAGVRRLPDGTKVTTSR